MIENAKIGTSVPPVEEKPSNEIRRLNREYREAAMRLQKIEGILRDKYELQVPAVARIPKSISDLISDEMIDKVRESLADRCTVSLAQFNLVLALAGIDGPVETELVTSELAEMEMIEVEEHRDGDVRVRLLE